MRSDLLDDAGNFMSENRRRRETISSLDDLQIRVAYSARRHFDQDIFLGYVGYVQIFDLQGLAGFVQNSGFHGSLLSLTRRP
jgi:hypothetical protein